MKRKTTKFAVIGSGRQAWLAFFPWIAAHPHAEIIAVADSNREMAEKAASKFKIPKIYDDGMDMIMNSGADALIVCTPPWFHGEPTIAAAQQGMHVLCEKPMATTVDECVRMTRACDDNGVFLQIGFSLRFDPGYEIVKSMVKRGEIGKVHQLRAIYDLYVPDLSNPLIQEGMKLASKILSFSSDMGVWRMKDERTGGGVHSDHGIHYVDLYRWFLDDEVTTASGIVQQVKPGCMFEDHASSLLRFGGGAAAYIESSLVRTSAFPDLDEGLINGVDGCIRYEMDQSWYLRGFPHLNDTHACVWKYTTPLSLLGGWIPVNVPHGVQKVMFKRQMDYFISKIDGTFRPHPVFGEKWGADGKDGTRAIQTVQAVYQSSKTSETVLLADPFVAPDKKQGEPKSNTKKRIPQKKKTKRLSS
jgi:UDP-N-acetylglucosamine 3-dehydrogenase